MPQRLTRMVSVLLPLALLLVAARADAGEKQKPRRLSATERTPSPKKLSPPKGMGPVCAACSPDGRLVLLGLHEGSLALFSLKGSDAPTLEPVAGKRPLAVAFTSGGSHVMALHAGGVRVWPLDKETGK